MSSVDLGQLLKDKETELEQVMVDCEQAYQVWLTHDRIIKDFQSKRRQLTLAIQQLEVEIDSQQTTVELKNQMDNLTTAEQEALVDGMDKRDYRECSQAVYYGSPSPVPRYRDLDRLVKRVTSVKANHPDWRLTQVKIAMTQQSDPPFHTYALTFVTPAPEHFQVHVSA